MSTLEVPRVLVTGASGFLASHILKQLLEGGQFIVRGTVRSLANEKKIAPLKRLFPDAKYDLELVEADLLVKDSWERSGDKNSLFRCYKANVSVWQGADLKSDLLLQLNQQQTGWLQISVVSIDAMLLLIVICTCVVFTPMKFSKLIAIDSDEQEINQLKNSELHSVNGEPIVGIKQIEKKIVQS